LWRGGGRGGEVLAKKGEAAEGGVGGWLFFHCVGTST
jgi:hypothetical protein